MASSGLSHQQQQSRHLLVVAELIQADAEPFRLFDRSTIGQDTQIETSSRCQLMHARRLSTDHINTVEARSLR